MVIPDKFKLEIKCLSCHWCKIYEVSKEQFIVDSDMLALLIKAGEDHKEASKDCTVPSDDLWAKVDVEEALKSLQKIGRA